MLLGNRGQSRLVLQERHSRLILAQPMHRKAAAPMAQAMTQLLATLPPQWRQTVTFDNGREFAQHHRLHDLGIETFFCDTHSPWQKGGGRTPTAGCVATCPASLTWPSCLKTCPFGSFRPTTTRPASAWVTGLRRKSILTSCCT